MRYQMQSYSTKMSTVYGLKSFALRGAVVAQWSNLLTLQPEQSGGVGSIPGRAQPLERHDKGLLTRLALSCFYYPNAWR